MKWIRRLAQVLIVLVFGAGCVLLAQMAPEISGLVSEGGETVSSGDVRRIRVSYPYYEGISDISDLDLIEEAVNEITEDRINVSVELVPQNITTAYEDYFLTLSSGEVMDLVLLREQDIDSYINQNLIQPINGYLKRNSSYISLQDRLADGNLTQGATQQGKLYGISNISTENAYGWGLWISGQVLEEAGVVWQKDHVYTLEELDGILVQLKAAYPDSYPLGQLTSYAHDTSVKKYMDPGDALGADLITGVVRSDSDVVENLFATDAYREFLTWMRRWYEAEYIYPISATYEASVIPLLEEKEILSFPTSSVPGTMDQILGEETDYVCLQMTPVYWKDGNELSDYWAVPTTSRYPADAMRFLDLLYSDLNLGYLLNYGISGRHYVIADWDYRLVEPLKDESGGWNGFYNPFARIGDLTDLYQMGTPEEQEERLIYLAGAVDRSSRYDGFVFETASVAQQIEEVRQVVMEYIPILESGSVGVDGNYEEFLLKLREAGIDEVLSEKQAQLDAWLQRQGADQESGDEG